MPLCGSIRPTKSGVRLLGSRGSGQNRAVSTPPEITRAQGWPSCPKMRRLYSLRWRCPWNQRSVDTYADTSQPPPPSSVTNTRRPLSRHHSATALAVRTCCWWQCTMPASPIARKTPG